MSGSDGVGSVMMGSPTVFINGQMACRVGRHRSGGTGLGHGADEPDRRRVPHSCDRAMKAGKWREGAIMSAAELTVPFEMQSDPQNSRSCGAASLSMVYRSFGKEIRRPTFRLLSQGKPLWRSGFDHLPDDPGRVEPGLQRRGHPGAPSAACSAHLSRLRNSRDHEPSPQARLAGGSFHPARRHRR